MKIYKNKSLKILKAEDLKNLDDLSIVIESCSSTYRELLQKHFEYQQRVDDGIWQDVHVGTYRIAKEVGCDEKTVDRFNSDMGALVHHQRRWKGGKQTSNRYQMSKIVYQYMKAFWRLGLFKKGNPFKIWWEWIKKIWQECGCDHQRFMNKVWSHKSFKPQEVRNGSEQTSEKMSHGGNAKCPTIYNSLSQAMKICTGWVPSSEIKRIEELLLRKAREALIDMKWFARDKSNSVRSYPGLFADLLKRTLTPRKV